MIAVDTNLLVYAHRSEMKLHQSAANAIEKLIGAQASWAIPWSCLHEFIAVVTNSRIFKTPTPIKLAFESIHSWQQGNNLYFIGEGEHYLSALEAACKSPTLSGSKIHDARIAAICIHHGIKELWTCDRDFSIFPGLKTRNPLA
jgi:hypothetical protein